VHLLTPLVKSALPFGLFRYNLVLLLAHFGKLIRELVKLFLAGETCLRQAIKHCVFFLGCQGVGEFFSDFSLAFAGCLGCHSLTLAPLSGKGTELCQNLLVCLSLLHALFY